jgi:AmmeMemoRadiSam system protein A
MAPQSPSHADGARLIAFVRASLEAAVCGAQPPAPPDDPVLETCRGCFVTLHKAGRLRGCIGRIEVSSGERLAELIPAMCAAAALRDPRFPPVRSDELASIDVELSLLTPPRAVKSLDDVRPGIDGVIVRGGNQTGCFLPQVGTETGWSARQLVETCLVEKAGLPRDAFDRGAATLETFQAEIFGETRTKS